MLLQITINMKYVLSRSHKHYPKRKSLLNLQPMIPLNVPTVNLWVVPVRNFSSREDVLAVVHSTHENHDQDKAVVPDLVATELAELQEYGIQVYVHRHGGGKVRSRRFTSHHDTRPSLPPSVWRASVVIAQPNTGIFESRCTRDSRQCDNRLSNYSYREVARW